MLGTDLCHGQQKPTVLLLPFCRFHTADSRAAVQWMKKEDEDAVACVTA
jgi:hypothetical protein